MLDEWKRAKPSTFDGELKKLEDAKAWFLVMKTFFDMNEFIENMQARIAIFNLKGKVDICWEDVKHVRGINIEELRLNEFKIFFRNK